MKLLNSNTDGLHAIISIFGSCMAKKKIKTTKLHR